MPEIPAPAVLGSEHLRDARLFANRNDLVRHLTRPCELVGEVGVALGDFSDFLIETLRPRTFVGIDNFVIHQYDKLWGTPTKQIFGTDTHEFFYREKMKKHQDCNVIVDPGLSDVRLATYEDRSFDFLYIDADHRYDQVKRDAQQAARKIKDDGVVIFNDYVIYDIFAAHEYGVVPVVNELITDHGFKIIGFALQQWMFCDIAVSKSS
jgi:Methyltransferase domain